MTPIRGRHSHLRTVQIVSSSWGKYPAASFIHRRGWNTVKWRRENNKTRHTFAFRILISPIKDLGRSRFFLYPVSVLLSVITMHMSVTRSLTATAPVQRYAIADLWRRAFDLLKRLPCFSSGDSSISNLRSVGAASATLALTHTRRCLRPRIPSVTQSADVKPRPPLQSVIREGPYQDKHGGLEFPLWCSPVSPDVR